MNSNQVPEQTANEAYNICQLAVQFAWANYHHLTPLHSLFHHLHRKSCNFTVFFYTSSIVLCITKNILFFISFFLFFFFSSLKFLKQKKPKKIVDILLRNKKKDLRLEHIYVFVRKELNKHIIVTATKCPQIRNTKPS